MPIYFNKFTPNNKHLPVRIYIYGTSRDKNRLYITSNPSENGAIKSHSNNLDRNISKGDVALKQASREDRQEIWWALRVQGFTQQSSFDDVLKTISKQKKGSK